MATERAPRRARARRSSAAAPCVPALEAGEHPLRRVRPPPVAGGVLVRLHERRIDMDRAEDLVEPDAVLHRGDELDEQIAGVLADDRRAEDAVASWRCQHLGEALGRLLGDGAIELGKLIYRRLVLDAA